MRSVVPKSMDCTPKAKKDRIISLLSKINDRDTQKRATEELHELVYSKTWMDTDALLTMVQQLCIPTPVQKVFARKECAHILGMLTTRQCPMQSTAVSAPTLHKVIMQLRKYMQDADTPVRDAASEAAARVAQGIWECGDVAGESQSGSTNPVGRMLLDCLAEGKKELQAAACGALGQAAPYLGKVDTVMVKEVIRRMSSPSFQAHTALLIALGQVDPATGAATGLIQSGGSVLHQHLPQLIGHPGALSTPGAVASEAAMGGGAQTPSTGLCASLGSKDWMTRRAAAECLRALFLVLGPLCEPEGAWDASDVRSLTARCSRILDGARFDKVREVRDSAREAAALLEVLRTYSTSGGGALCGWDAHAKSAMAAAKGSFPAEPTAAPLPSAQGLPRPRSSAQSRISVRTLDPHAPSRLSPPVSPDSKPHPRPALNARPHSLSARFKEAHGDVDIIVESNHKHRQSARGVTQDRLSGPQPQAAAGSPQNSVTNGDVGAKGQQHSELGPEEEQPQSHAICDEAQNSHQAADLDLTLCNGNLGFNQAERPQHLNSDHTNNSAQQEGSMLGHGLVAELSQPASLHHSHLELHTQPEQNHLEQLHAQQGPQHTHEQPQNSHHTQPSALGTDPQALKEPSWCLLASHDEQQPLYTAEGSTYAVGDPHEGLNKHTGAIGHSSLEGGDGQAATNHAQGGGSTHGGAAIRAHTEGGVHVAVDAAYSGWQPDDGAITVQGEGSSSTITVLAAEWHGLQQRLRDMEQLVADLQSQVAGLGQRKVGGPSSWVQPSSPKRQAAVNLQGAPCSADVNAMYTEALQHNTGPRHLLELMQHTGISWSDLQPQVAHQLLAAFATCAQYPEVLPKAMPWLWRLADEQQTPSHLQPQALPPATREKVLEGLSQAATTFECSHALLSSKAALLLQTLRCHWGPMHEPLTLPPSPPPLTLSPHHQNHTTLLPLSFHSPTRVSASNLSSSIRPPSPPPLAPGCPASPLAHRRPLASTPYSQSPTQPPASPKSSMTRSPAGCQPSPIPSSQTHANHPPSPTRPSLNRPSSASASILDSECGNAHSAPNSNTSSPPVLNTSRTMTGSKAHQQHHLLRNSPLSGALQPSRPLSAPFLAGSLSMREPASSSAAKDLLPASSQSMKESRSALPKLRSESHSAKVFSSWLHSSSEPRLGPLASPIHEQQLRPWVAGDAQPHGGAAGGARNGGALSHGAAVAASAASLPDALQADDHAVAGIGQGSEREEPQQQQQKQATQVRLDEARQAQQLLRKQASKQQQSLQETQQQSPPQSQKQASEQQQQQSEGPQLLRQMSKQQQKVQQDQEPHLRKQASQKSQEHQKPLRLQKRSSQLQQHHNLQEPAQPQEQANVQHAPPEQKLGKQWSQTQQDVYEQPQHRLPQPAHEQILPTERQHNVIAVPHQKPGPQPVNEQPQLIQLEVHDHSHSGLPQPVSEQAAQEQQQGDSTEFSLQEHPQPANEQTATQHLQQQVQQEAHEDLQQKPAQSMSEQVPELQPQQQLSQEAHEHAQQEPNQPTSDRVPELQLQQQISQPVAQPEQHKRVREQTQPVAPQQTVQHDDRHRQQDETQAGPTSEHVQVDQGQQTPQTDLQTDEHMQVDPGQQTPQTDLQTNEHMRVDPEQQTPPTDLLTGEHKRVNPEQQGPEQVLQQQHLHQVLSNEQLHIHEQLPPLGHQHLQQQQQQRNFLIEQQPVVQEQEPPHEQPHTREQTPPPEQQYMQQQQQQQQQNLLVEQQPVMQEQELSHEQPHTHEQTHSPEQQHLQQQQQNLPIEQHPIGQEQEYLHQQPHTHEQTPLPEQQQQQQQQQQQNLPIDQHPIVQEQ